MLFGSACLGLAAAAACTKDSITWIYDDGPHWPSRAVFPGIGNGLVAVTNSYDDTLSLLDVVTLDEVAKIPLGLLPVELEGPHHVKTSPDGQFLYVGLSLVVPNAGGGPHGSHGTGTSPGYVLKIRTSDMRLVGQTRVDRNPGDLVVSPDGATVYVSHFDVKRIEEVAAQGGSADAMRSAIARIDTATMTREALVPVCPAEHGIVLSPAGDRLYVSCYGNDRVAVVDVTDDAMPATMVPLGPGTGALPGSIYFGPYAMTLDAANDTLWMSSWESGELRALDTQTLTVDTARTISTGGRPMFGSLDGDRVLIARQSNDPSIHDDRLLVISSGGASVQTIMLPEAQCMNAHDAHPIPGQPGKALVVCEGHHVTPGTVIRVDIASGTVETSTEVGVFPDAASFVMPGGGR